MQTTEPKANVNALSKKQLVGLLVKFGSKASTLERIDSDIALGAPANGDGSINLIHYAAWLVAKLDD